MRLPAIALSCLLLLFPEMAEAACRVPPAPASSVPKSDSGTGCPAGYRPTGSTCLPGTGARPALPKPEAESCPAGYTASGEFCVAGIAACHILRKSGPCPDGYRASGRAWCVSG
ncbi:hypothetical protein [Novispirillum itersonii]|uniref:Uncharacterized protein n=1 Tax=Novispirillum itersonii TaxID=189 RepID=A0A7W9ZJZ0_NOVIT|nr:hypothetical protein [Novispirillum itersonii]MBB6211634.1 hypothetical protein [Novispirillum itersonii]